MSIPTQGAEGADTMTAGIGPRTITTSRQTCAGCPALQTKEWTFYGENDDTDSGTDGKCTAAGKVISGYWSERDPTPDWCPALASPSSSLSARTAFKPGDLVRNARYNDRDTYPAFGESAYVQAVDGDYLDFGQGNKLHSSLFDLVTPAQPAGAVPDSLRALIREIVNATYAMTAAPLGTEVARLYRAAQPLAEFISTHPAGQSAGSGAGPAAFDWVKRAADAIPPGPTGPVRVLSGPEEAPGLLDQVSSEQAEAFERTASNLVNLYAPDGPSALRQGILAALLRAHLATRPAAPEAPEAQGAWIEIDKAPGGEIVLVGWWGTVGDQRRWFYDVGPTPHGEETHYRPLPAPPASSGQGGR